MINLRFATKHSELKEGNVIHLRIRAKKTKAPGKYELWVDDITPLPGTEPTGYACHLCGLIEAANDDGSLPDGWVQKEFPERSFFVCKICNEGFHEPYCRVCGCMQNDPCFDSDNNPCWWVEENLCSACQGKGEVKNEPNS